jgi:hypothetical protein
MLSAVLDAVLDFIEVLVSWVGELLWRLDHGGFNRLGE